MTGEEPPGGARRQSHSVPTENREMLVRLRSLFQLSVLLRVWEALVAASIVLSVVLVVFQAAFDAGIVWQWVLIYLCDGLYIVGVVIRFVTWYIKKGVLVTDRARESVVLNYLKLTADLGSIIPLELFAFAATGSRGETLVLAAVLRLNRCIRCYRTWNFISEW